MRENALPYTSKAKNLHKFNPACVETGIFRDNQGPLLLTWINFNSSMDK